MSKDRLHREILRGVKQMLAPDSDDHAGWLEEGFPREGGACVSWHVQVKGDRVVARKLLVAWDGRDRCVGTRRFRIILEEISG